MKHLIESWKSYLLSEQDGEYFQKIYKIVLRVYIRKQSPEGLETSRGLADKGQTQQDIRAIADVLTVASRPGGQKETEDLYISDMEIRYRVSKKTIDPRIAAMHLKERIKTLPSVSAVEGGVTPIDVSRKT
tara:strand:+ start:36586 stop:36978 length:393 start_codon:yes stop_codon:yes gene_type:complete